MTDLTEKLFSGDRRALAKIITKLENTTTSVDELESLLEQILPRRTDSIRIGISGIPGVGKSTFIEQIGEHILQDRNKLAVLAIDPSSPVSGGAILGDRTRMTNLSANDSAFIRPSPNDLQLGGIARRTRESCFACEAAGYDTVVIETVGVGQSEVAVANLVDVFLLLALPNAGDELQGIKRGVLELTDICAITKADGPSEAAARLTKKQLEQSLHLSRQDSPPVLLTSSFDKVGIDAVWDEVKKFVEKRKSNHDFQKRRQEQMDSWFHEEIMAQFRSNLDKSKAVQAATSQVRGGKSPFRLAQQTLASILR